jgi:hypothetical protein
MLRAAIGAGFACLPDKWIEETFGIDPDGGNGWIEVLLAAAPISMGLGLLFEAWMWRRASRKSESVASG